jgi:hypothetical protein
VRQAPTRINAGGLVAAVGAILLLVSLFLDWFDPGLTAWDAFEIVDLLLALIALAAIAAAASSLDARLPLEDRLLLPLGGAATLLVVHALIDHPPAAAGLDPVEGAWLALAGSLLLLIGGLLTVVRVSLAFDVERNRRPARRAATPPPPPPPARRSARPGAAPAGRCPSSGRARRCRARS